MCAPIVRVASADEHPSIEQFYRREGYNRSVAPSDIVVVAESGGHTLGVVKLSSEHGCLVLRGMRVREDSRRRGIGSSLLRSLIELIGGRACYCLPFAHLVEFYARAGFSLLSDDEVPPFLRERADHYRQMGDAIAPMLRKRGLTCR